MVKIIQAVIRGIELIILPGRSINCKNYRLSIIQKQLLSQPRIRHQQKMKGHKFQDINRLQTQFVEKKQIKYDQAKSQLQVIVKKFQEEKILNQNEKLIHLNKAQ
ncbi:hypothetical protein ABPG74_010075 [Tetrahymena malaccensis]